MLENNHCDDDNNDNDRSSIKNSNSKKFNDKTIERESEITNW